MLYDYKKRTAVIITGILMFIFSFIFILLAITTDESEELAALCGLAIITFAVSAICGIACFIESRQEYVAKKRMVAYYEEREEQN